MRLIKKGGHNSQIDINARIFSLKFLRIIQRIIQYMYIFSGKFEPNS